VFSNNQENQASSIRVYAVDTHGFLWSWGDNTTGYMGIGTALPTTITSPVRLPAFMANGSVNANPAINQPAASGTRKRVKKITAIAVNAETFALIEKDDTNLATESGVFFWGNNTGCTGAGNNTGTTYLNPQQFSRSALNLNTGEWVVDIFANMTRSDAILSGTFSILTNTGRLLTCGTNTYGVLANGGNTVNNFASLAEVSTAAINGGVWATPLTWTVPTGMTSSDFNTQWTGATFEAQFDSLDETWAFSGTFRYAKTALGIWAFWGTQDPTSSASRSGHAGTGNLVAAQYTPAKLSFRDSQHEENFTFLTASDQFDSLQLATGNTTPGFTISKIRHVGGMWNDTLATNFIRAVTVVIMSNGRVYVTGYNGQGQAGSGDTFSSTGFFRRVRLDDPIISEGTIVDARVVRGQSTGAGNPVIRILYSNGDVYAWGYSASGSGLIGASSFVPTRVQLGGVNI
jgi:hypothetical protein